MCLTDQVWFRKSKKLPWSVNACAQVNHRDVRTWLKYTKHTSICVSLLSAAATSVSMFKAEPNPVLYEGCLSMPTEMGCLTNQAQESEVRDFGVYPGKIYYQELQILQINKI